MKKVGIITVHGYHNYGNRLQAYAVQKIIEDLGFDVVTIKTKTSLTNIKPTKLQSLYNNRHNLFNKIVSKISNLKYKELSNKRLKRFETFTSKHIKETSFYISNNAVPNTIDDNYDFFVTGSDQVWNPVLKGTDIEFLQFASQQKRVAFSASIGTSFIPEERQAYYKKALNDMHSISVRENEAKDIVKQLTGRKDIEVLVDPTMLLSKEEWLDITTSSMLQSSPYILVYFLGEKSSQY